MSTFFFSTNPFADKDQYQIRIGGFVWNRITNNLGWSKQSFEDRKVEVWRGNPDDGVWCKCQPDKEQKVLSHLDKTALFEKAKQYVPGPEVDLTNPFSAVVYVL
jgi:hypothetical protein